MVVGSLILMGFSFAEVGGSYEQLYVRYMESVPSNFQTLLNTSSQTMENYVRCGLPKENSFQMLRSIGDNDMPWLGFLLGKTPSSIWYWCSDQVWFSKFLIRFLQRGGGGNIQEMSAYKPMGVVKRVENLYLD